VLFNSPLFLVSFLPATVAGFWLLQRRGWARPALFWLLLTSLAYYGWWEPKHLGLILLSSGVNYGFGRALARRRGDRTLPALGVGVNLAALAWFKYAGFLLANFNRLTRGEAQLGTIVLPLAISFFTFQQISYLVDVYRGEPAEPDLLHYTLFVTLFPQFIAGPVVRQ
jgi:alginate O-acetyltransferase complex protein AlgI